MVAPPPIFIPRRRIFVFVRETRPMQYSLAPATTQLLSLLFLLFFFHSFLGMALIYRRVFGSEVISWTEITVRWKVPFYVRTERTGHIVSIVNYRGQLREITEASL